MTKADLVDKLAKKTNLGRAESHQAVQVILEGMVSSLQNGVKVDMLAGGKYQGIQLRQPIRAVGYAAPQLDPNKVASALQGKTADDAKKYLASAAQLAQSPDIRVSPPGWPLMPLLAFRIAVFIETPMVGK